MKRQLIRDHLGDLDELDAEGRRFRDWPVGDYLLRMAKSAEQGPRHLVYDALLNTSDTKSPEVRRKAMEIMSALPAVEASRLAHIVAAWLGEEVPFFWLHEGERLVQHFAKGRQADAALMIARPLFKLFDRNGDV